MTTPTPIVFLHGFLGDGRDLEPLAHCLTERGLNHVVACPTLPGHGPDPEPITGRGNPFMAVIDYLAARLEMIGLTRFHVVGYSMGGRVAYGLMIKYPDRVASAVTIGASPGLSDPAARAARARNDRDRSEQLETVGLPAFLESWYAMPLFDTLRAHPAFAAMQVRRREGHASDLASALRAMSPGVMPDFTPELRQTSIPIRAIAGALDTKYAAVVRSLAERNPAIEADVIADVGHAAHIENPDAVASAIVEHLRRIER